MRIGSTDISVFNAKQRTVSYSSHNSISNGSEWRKGAVLPYLSANRIGFKTLTVTMWVYGTSRAQICARVSNILALMINKVTLTLDDSDHLFTGILKSHKHEERAVNKWHILTLTLDGYEHGALTTVSGKTSIAVNNPGNIISPAIVTLTASSAVASAKLTGLCRDSFTGADLEVTVPSLVSGSPVVIDALTGLVTQGGNPKKMDLWALPSVVPGANTVTCNSTKVTVKVEVLPLYI